MKDETCWYVWLIWANVASSRWTSLWISRTCCWTRTICSWTLLNLLVDVCSISVNSCSVSDNIVLQKKSLWNFCFSVKEILTWNYQRDHSMVQVTIGPVDLTIPLVSEWYLLYLWKKWKEFLSISLGSNQTECWCGVNTGCTCYWCTGRTAYGWYGRSK